MAIYNYCCLACLGRAAAAKGGPLTAEEEDEAAVFETSHAMEPTKREYIEATKCPRCGVSDARLVLRDCNVIGYIKGNGYLDRAGCHRDMNVHKLENDDPYAEMREPGETDDLKQRLRKAGQHDPKTKHFPQGGA